MQEVAPLRGEVYWTDFDPVVGSEQGGRRPAVIVQNDVGNAYSPITIVVPLTTRRPGRRYPFHVWVSEPTLGRPGVALCNHVTRIDKTRLLTGPVATLDDVTMRKVDDALKVSLGLY